MNGPLLKTTLTLAFAAVSFSMSSMAFAGHSVDTTDQVAASFDRLLNPAPTKSAAVPQVAATFPADAVMADPLMAGMNRVLWQKPSYHLPAQFAFFSGKRIEIQ